MCFAALQRSAMYVNVVSDFYPKANLGGYLQARRDTRAGVDEEVSSTLYMHQIDHILLVSYTCLIELYVWSTQLHQNAPEDRIV